MYWVLGQVIAACQTIYRVQLYTRCVRLRNRSLCTSTAADRYGEGTETEGEQTDEEAAMDAQDTAAATPPPEEATPLATPEATPAATPAEVKEEATPSVSASQVPPQLPLLSCQERAAAVRSGACRARLHHRSTLLRCAQGRAERVCITGASPAASAVLSAAI